MDIVRRVLNRALIASLEEGRGLFTDHLKIHRYRENLLITDITNAGKRGKKVRELHVEVGYGVEDPDKVLKDATDLIMHSNYDKAKEQLEGLIEKGTSIRLNESVRRGVDVEPPGTKISLRKVFPDKHIVDITASPHDFLVKDSAPMGGTREDGEPHFRQDTSYWPVKKQDAIAFYTWIKAHMSEASKMTVQELIKVWQANNIRFNSH